MNLRDLEYVIALAEHRNFTRAADAAAVSQPALSNQIKKLEAELGVASFERSQAGVHLTAFGQDVLSHAQQVIGLVDAITDTASRHRATPDKPLRLGMTPTLAAYLSRYLRNLFACIADGRKIVIVEDYPAALSKTARFETVCRYVAQSDACTIVNAIAAEQFKRDGFGLAFIPFDDAGNTRELGVLTRPNYPHPDVISALQVAICKQAPAGTIASCRKGMARAPALAGSQA